MEGKRKHLTLADRIQIERGLDSNKNFTEIGKEIGKDPTTVSKEVRKHIKVKEALFSRAGPPLTEVRTADIPPSEGSVQTKDFMI